MNKCSKCGTEFEGKFCPECGAKYENTNDCPQPATKPNATKTKTYQTVHKLLSLLPLALFALFATLNFAFMACSAANLLVSWGNVYAMSSDYYLSGYAIALIVFAALTCVAVLLYFLLTNLANSRRKTALIANVIMYVAYLLVLVAAITLNVAVTKDGFYAGSATKLIIAFAVIFATFSVAAPIVDKVLAKRNEQYAQAVSEINAQPNRVQKLASNVKGYYDSHTKKARAICILIATLLLASIVVGIAVPVATDTFNTTQVAKVGFGDSKSTVEKLLGKADVENNYEWIYYGKYLKHLKDVENAMKNQDDLDDLFGNLEESLKAEEKLAERKEKIQDKVLTVKFDGEGKVVSVELDANPQSDSNKTVKKAEFTEKYVNLNIDWTEYNDVDIRETDFDITEHTELHAKIYYKDGSYKLTAVDNTKATLLVIGFSNWTHKIEKGYIIFNGINAIDIQWKDSWAEEPCQARLSFDTYREIQKEETKYTLITIVRFVLIALVVVLPTVAIALSVSLVNKHKQQGIQNKRARRLRGCSITTFITSVVYSVIMIGLIVVELLSDSWSNVSVSLLAGTGIEGFVSLVCFFVGAPTARKLRKELKGTEIEKFCTKKCGAFAWIFIATFALVMTNLVLSILWINGTL